jgi:hypothetical protein
VLEHNAGAMEVFGRSQQPVLVVSELAKASVAVEAEDPADLSGSMVMVDVFGIRAITYGADTTLLRDQRGDFGCANSVSTSEVVVATPPVEALLRLIATRVVAGLAVGVPSVAAVAVPREALKGFPLFAVRATLHAADRTGAM